MISHKNVSAVSVYACLWCPVLSLPGRIKGCFSNFHTKLTHWKMKEGKGKVVKRNKQEKEREVLVGQCLVIGWLAGWLEGKLVWYGGLWFWCRCNFTGSSGCPPFCRRQTLWRTIVTHTQTQEAVHEQGSDTHEWFTDLHTLFIKCFCWKAQQTLLKNLTQSSLTGHHEPLLDWDSYMLSNTRTPT